jgi:hypothetical protein
MQVGFPSKEAGRLRATSCEGITKLSVGTDEGVAALSVVLVGEEGAPTTVGSMWNSHGGGRHESCIISTAGEGVAEISSVADKGTAASTAG